MEKKRSVQTYRQIIRTFFRDFKLQKSRVQWLLHINITFFKQIKKQQQI